MLLVHTKICSNQAVDLAYIHLSYKEDIFVGHLDAKGPKGMVYKVGGQPNYCAYITLNTSCATRLLQAYDIQGVHVLRDRKSVV